MRPSRARARLTQHVYTRPTAYNPIGTLDSVLQKVIAVEPLEEKLYQASKHTVIKGKNFAEKVNAAGDMGILTQREVQQLCEAQAARLSITNVDDFSPIELTREVGDNI